MRSWTEDLVVEFMSSRMAADYVLELGNDANDAKML